VPLLPRFLPVTLDYTYVDPNLAITLVFDENMDQTVVPLPAQFILTCNGILKIADSIAWDDATHLSVDYSEAILDVDPCLLRYKAKNINFLSVAGELVTPFEILIAAAP